MAQKRKTAQDPGKELLDLVQSLRLRVSASDEGDWRLRTAVPGGEGRFPLAGGGWTARAPSSRKPGAPASARVPAPARVSDSLPELASRILSCRRCPLAAARIKAVPGVGSPSAEVVFVGEGPGYEEDRRGEPFVGKAGQLLDRILEAMGFSRESVFIANIVKCHPMRDPSAPEARGNDRPPTPEEIAACREYLDRQIAAIRPRVIVGLGAVSAKALLGTDEGITKLRGRWASYLPPGGTGEPIPFMPTFHPAALLRDPSLKPLVWADMKAVLARLGRHVPPAAKARREGGRDARCASSNVAGPGPAAESAEDAEDAEEAS